MVDSLVNFIIYHDRINNCILSMVNKYDNKNNIKIT